MIHPNQQTVNNHHQSHYRPSASDTSADARPHRLDLYSIPVFFLEVLVLALLALSAYFIHTIYFLEPLVTGFYCDDRAYRNVFKESELTKHLVQETDELTVLALLVAIPITFIIFCELINSMFGSIRFRRVRALCKCCKLHSITRRAIRFSGAYLLGFLIVSISCDILSSSTGQLRPYFELKCPNAYKTCQQSRLLSNHNSNNRLIDSTSLPTAAALINDNINATTITPTTIATPPAQPIITSANSIIENIPTTTQTPSGVRPSAVSISAGHPREGSRIIDASSNARDAGSMPPQKLINQQFLQDRQWIDLNSLGPNLSVICSFDDQTASNVELFQFQQLARSWPSYPGAIFAYSCLFVATYLSFAGTARPIRIVTCVLVLGLMMIATVFNVQLVKEHFNHYEDVLAGGALALVVNIFIVTVYLNLFRDTHYYERQKMISPRRIKVHENFRPYDRGNGSEFGTYNIDDGNNSDEHSNDEHVIPTHTANGQLRATENGDIDGSGVHPASGNDLAMRYFQIPRANYRNAPRPLSNIEQMR